MQALLGHAHVDTTARYIHLAPAHVKAEFDAARDRIRAQTDCSAGTPPTWHHLARSGRGNTAYWQAARVFFRRWPDPQRWAGQPLRPGCPPGRATRPIITFLMLHRVLRPGYDYLLERKLSSIWREIKDSPLGPISTGSWPRPPSWGSPSGSASPPARRSRPGCYPDRTAPGPAHHRRPGRVHRGLSRPARAHRQGPPALPGGGQQHPAGAVPPRDRRSAAPFGRPVPFAERLAEVSPPIRETMIASWNASGRPASPRRSRRSPPGSSTSGCSSPTSSRSSIAASTAPPHRPYLTSLVDAVNPKNDADHRRRPVPAGARADQLHRHHRMGLAEHRRLVFRDDTQDPQALSRYLPVDVDRRLTQALTAPRERAGRGRTAAAAVLGLQLRKASVIALLLGSITYCSIIQFVETSKPFLEPIEEFWSSWADHGAYLHRFAQRRGSGGDGVRTMLLMRAL